MEQKLNKELKLTENLRDLEAKKNEALEATKKSWAELVSTLDRKVEGNF
jgi:hypothetical protein